MSMMSGAWSEYQQFSQAMPWRPPRAARIMITVEALRSVLDLPEDIEITGAHMDPKYQGLVNIIVRGPDLPECPPGAELPVMSIKHVRGWDE